MAEIKGADVSKKILVIDDDNLVLKTFESLLRRAGYEVISASCYDDALKAFGSSQFDLVLSDIRMPGKNGVEAVSEIQSTLIKSGKKDLPIIFITGYAKDSIQLNAEFIGEVLTKPVDSTHLLMTIREYL